MACSATVTIVAPQASAHIVAKPAFVATGRISTINLSALNERDAPMTEFRVTVPDGFVIDDARTSDSWEPTIRGSTVRWRGGSLPAGGETEFGVELETTGEPRPAQLEADQLYPSGDVVSWTVAITVIPGSESPSQNPALAAVVGAIGLLGIAGVVAVAWWRRGRSIRES